MRRTVARLEVRLEFSRRKLKLNLRAERNLPVLRTLVCCSLAACCNKQSSKQTKRQKSAKGNPLSICSSDCARNSAASSASFAALRACFALASLKSNRGKLCCPANGQEKNSSFGFSFSGQCRHHFAEPSTNAEREQRGAWADHNSLRQLSETCFGLVSFRFAHFGSVSAWLCARSSQQQFAVGETSIGAPPVAQLLVALSAL